MIKRNELVPVGNIGKPHGLSGEMSMSIDPDIPVEDGTCLITPVDGIYVPFFVTSVRNRSQETRLVRLDGIESASEASQLNGLPLFMTIEYIDSLPEDDAEEDSDCESDDNLYIGSLVGSRVIDTDGADIGTITGINADTANVLFEVQRPDGSDIFIPVSEEFIVAYDHDTSTLTLSLPEGLLDLQS